MYNALRLVTTILVIALGSNALAAETGTNASEATRPRMTSQPNAREYILAATAIILTDLKERHRDDSPDPEWESIRQKTYASGTIGDDITALEAALQLKQITDPQADQTPDTDRDNAINRAREQIRFAGRRIVEQMLRENPELPKNPQYQTMLRHAWATKTIQDDIAAVKEAWSLAENQNQP